MNVKYRLDWNGHNNIVNIDTADGSHVEMTLEDFVELADTVIIGTIERTNPAYRKSFDRLPSARRSARR